jgi:fatty acid-binding protein DegV
LSVVFEDEIIEEFGASNEEFYKKMDSVNYFPTSSQPSIELMREMFEAPIKAGNGVVGVFISSEMSGTYQSAVMVKNQLLEEYPDARFYPSRTGIPGFRQPL